MALVDDINALLPDNETGEITPADLRAVMALLLDNPGFVGPAGQNGADGADGADGQDGTSLPPIGFIAWFEDDTDPATAYGGGTWARYGEDRVLVSLGSTFDTAGAEGGAATVTLTAAQSGVPAHTHPTTGLLRSSTSGGATTKITQANDTSSTAAAFDVSANTAANAAQAHENMPPYIVAYAWVRTA